MINNEEKKKQKLPFYIAFAETKPIWSYIKFSDAILRIEVEGISLHYSSWDAVSKERSYLVHNIVSSFA